MGIIANIKERGVKDILSLKKIKVFIQSVIEYLNGVRVNKWEAKDYAENVLFRRLMCPECVEAGECVVCHCNMDDLVSTSKATCAGGKWKEMKYGQAWEEEKDKIMHGLDFGFVRKDEVK